MNAFRECGMPAWFVLAFAILGFTLAALALTLELSARSGKASKRTSLLLAASAIALGIGCAIVGVLGRAWGIHQVDEVIASGAINPALVGELRDAGVREANQCVSVGSLAASPALLLGFLTVVLATLFRQAPNTDT